MQTVDAQILKLEDIGLDDDEVAAVKQVLKISKLMRVQADHLKAYWQSGDQASLESFQQVRGESWLELRLIMGLASPLPK